MKNVILGIVLIVLAVAAYWLVTTNNDSTSVADENRRFYVEDKTEIYRIFIADRDQTSIDLKRQGDETWLVNDEYMARPWTIAGLLTTLEAIRIRFIPTKGAVKHIIPELAAHGLKVELYDRQGKAMKVFYVGGTTNDDLGTYMMMEGGDQVYVTHIPGWDGGLRAKFPIELTDWRDKALYREDPEKIKSVTVKYTKLRNKSFELSKNGDTYAVEPAFSTTTKMPGVPKQGLVDSYLMGFEEVYCEAFESTNPRRDSVIQSIPFCTIDITRTDDSELNVEFFPVINQQRELYDPNYHIHRFFVNRSDGDFMLIQYNNFKNLLWSYDAFFAENQ